MKSQRVLMFWGAVDLLYVGYFCYSNYLIGRIPLYSDTGSFVQLADQHGLASYLLFALTLMLNVSIVISAFMLICGSRLAHCLVYFQTPFRILLVVPSLFFSPRLMMSAEVKSLVLLIGVLVVAEAAKVISVIYRERMFSSGHSR